MELYGLRVGKQSIVTLIWHNEDGSWVDCTCVGVSVLEKARELFVAIFIERDATVRLSLFYLIQR